MDTKCYSMRQCLHREALRTHRHQTTVTSCDWSSISKFECLQNNTLQKTANNYCYFFCGAPDMQGPQSTRNSFFFFDLELNKRTIGQVTHPVQCKACYINKRLQLYSISFSNILSTATFFRRDERKKGTCLKGRNVWQYFCKAVVHAATSGTFFPDATCDYRLFKI